MADSLRSTVEADGAGLDALRQAVFVGVPELSTPTTRVAGTFWAKPATAPIERIASRNPRNRVKLIVCLRSTFMTAPKPRFFRARPHEAGTPRRSLSTPGR